MPRIDIRSHRKDVSRVIIVTFAVLVAAWPGLVRAQTENGNPDDSIPDGNNPVAAVLAPILPEGETEGLVRLDPEGEIWLDAKRKRVVINGQIAVTDGPLEMFACLKGTKEHESVVAARTNAYVAHAGLLALGAEPGGSVQFTPEYRPAQGTAIEISVYWRDSRGRARENRAQDWIRNTKTGKPMQHAWVFGGSRFWVDEKTGQRFYMAEDGDFICISNFASAMLDVPIDSSQSNASLLFEAASEKIPPRGTEVTIVLKPQLEKKGDDAGGPKGNP